MTRADSEAILAILEERYPSLPRLIEYHTTFQLLISVILTASTTDAQVNKITPRLFAEYPDALSMARCPDARLLEEIIHSVGLAAAKARYIHETAKIIAAHYNGKVPLDFDALLALPGVGRKSASVVLCHETRHAAVIVDTHYARVVQRIGLTTAISPRAIEDATKRLLAEETWCSFSQRINILGREYCKARVPKCVECPIQAYCQYAATQSQ